MGYAIKVLLLALALATPLTHVQQASAQDHYRYGEASRDGIGKFYMDREISQVMGHRGAGWLERPERVQQERTDLLLNGLELKPGETVADIGAGTGYFSLPIARMVEPDGRVLAVDIQPEMLAIIEQRMMQEDTFNIDMILASERDPKLPSGMVDTVLMVDAYHEFSYPREVLLGVLDSLTEKGRVILVEYRANNPSVPIKPLHTMSIAQASREMAAVGLQLEKVGDQLPWQHIMVFKRKTEGGSPIAARENSSARLFSF